MGDYDDGGSRRWFGFRREESGRCVREPGENGDSSGGRERDREREGAREIGKRAVVAVAAGESGLKSRPGGGLRDRLAAGMQACRQAGRNRRATQEKR